MSQLQIPSSYVARRNFFNFLGITCRILDKAGGLLFFIKMKAFKLREDITIFRDAARTQPLINIKARQILDISGGDGSSIDALGIEVASSPGIQVARRTACRTRPTLCIRRAPEGTCGGKGCRA